jgi:hypothetical protein
VSAPWSGAVVLTGRLLGRVTGIRGRSDSRLDAFVAVGLGDDFGTDQTSGFDPEPRRFDILGPQSYGSR